MTSPQPSDYRRVAVIAPGRRVDLAVPGDLPIADLMPDVLGLARIGVTDDVAGWRLGRIGGPGFATDRTLDEVGVRDGDVLLLRPGRLPDPLPVVDEITDVVAAVAAENGTVTASSVPRLALAISGAVLAATLPATWHQRSVAGAAVLVAAAVLAVGAAAGRRPGTRSLSSVFGPAALIYTAVGAAGLSRLPSSAELLVVSLMLLIATPLSARALGVGATTTAAMTTAAVFGALAGAAQLTGAAAGQIAVGVLVAATSMLPWTPRLAAATGRLSHPRSAPIDGELPRVELAELMSAARRAADHLIGVDLAIATATGISALVLVDRGGVWSIVLAALGMLSVLIRATVVQIPVQVGVLAVPVVAALVAGLVLTGSRLPVAAAPWIPTGALVLAGVIGVTGVVVPRREWSPTVHRVGRALGSVVVLGVVPVAVAALHGYDLVRHR